MLRTKINAHFLRNNSFSSFSSSMADKPAPAGGGSSGAESFAISPSANSEYLSGREQVQRGVCIGGAKQSRDDPPTSLSMIWLEDLHQSSPAQHERLWRELTRFSRGVDCECRLCGALSYLAAVYRHCRWLRRVALHGALCSSISRLPRHTQCSVASSAANLESASCHTNREHVNCCRHSSC